MTPPSCCSDSAPTAPATSWPGMWSTSPTSPGPEGSPTPSSIERNPMDLPHRAPTGEDAAPVAQDKPPFAWRELPRAEFGLPGELRDILLTALMAGTKTGTSSLLAEFEREGRDPLAERGGYELVVDSDEAPVAIMRIARVQVLPFAQVDVAHAETEGFPTIEQWRDAHLALWTSRVFLDLLGEPPIMLDGDTAVVLTRFRAYRPGDIVAGHVIDFDA
ncbi:ASCH domain-containing protein [Propionibacterium freudenreichii]|nr:ASCH domain-containing protein [Propionibacterium freudenreichii]MCT3003671.1 ASCH domain-containing protein [Propionibacterium freudenreichii]